MRLEKTSTGYMIRSETPPESRFLRSIGHQDWCPRMPGLLPDDNQGLVIYQSELINFFLNFNEWLAHLAFHSDSLRKLFEESLTETKNNA